MRSKWQAAGIGDYVFELEVVSIWTSPLVDRCGTARVTVAGGDIQSVRPDKGGWCDLYEKTIMDLFDLIQQAIDERWEFIEVEYDENTGYPVRISYAHLIEATDARFTFLVRALAPRPGW
jgi:hypothetical protein